MLNGRLSQETYKPKREYASCAVIVLPVRSSSDASYIGKEGRRDYGVIRGEKRENKGETSEYTHLVPSNGSKAGNTCHRENGR